MRPLAAADLLLYFSAAALLVVVIDQGIRTRAAAQPPGHETPPRRLPGWAVVALALLLGASAAGLRHYVGLAGKSQALAQLTLAPERPDLA